MNRSAKNLLILALAVHAFVFVPFVRVAFADVDEKPEWNETLKRGIAVYKSLEWEKARGIFEQAVRLTKATPEEIEAAYLYLGFIAMALNDTEKAKAHFTEALKINPSEELDPQLRSPKFIDAFKDARRKLVAQDTKVPSISLVPITEEVPYNKPVLITTSVTDNFLIKDVTIHFRRSGELLYDSNPMIRREGNIWAGTIPGITATGEEVDYYLKAVDEAGNSVTEGNANTPLKIAVEPEPSMAPWYTQWWIWGIVVVAIAGGVTGGVLAAQNQNEGPRRTGTAIINF